ncbi:MAG: efflux RND transporter periplasmic adaptor subunit [Candidatus Sericytochromatia bacterium]
MTKKRFIIISIICLLAFLGLIGYRVVEKKKLEKKIAETKPIATAVSIIEAKKEKISEFFATSGTIVSDLDVNIIPKATGKITALMVDEGSIVKKGDILAELEHNELSAQINQAKAQINVAKANLDLLVNGPLNTQITQAEAIVKQAEASLSQIKVNLDNSTKELARYKTLKEQGAITQQQLDSFKTQNEALKKQLEASQQQVISSKASLQNLKDGTRKEQVNAGKGQLEQAEAALSLLNTQLENYVVKAPIDGVVTKKLLDVGSMAGLSTPIVSMSKTNEPELEINIPEREILKIKINQIVEVESSAFPNKKLQVKIKEISPVVDPQTRLIRTRGLIKSDLPLKLGMIFDCRISFKEESNYIVIPNEAVLINESKKYVYISKNNKAVEKLISVGIQTPEKIQILSGLDEGEKVIVKGNTFIKSGDDIEIQKAIDNKI